MRCLIVDDNPEFLQAARVLLEQEGLRVVGVASTRSEAVQHVACLRPDVTLVDVDLGDESGFEVVRQLVADPHLDPGPLILISAKAGDDVAALVEASPALGFIGKLELSADGIEELLREGEPRL
jgi:CheY-like chemotaxis protein